MFWISIHPTLICTYKEVPCVTILLVHKIIFGNRKPSLSEKPWTKSKRKLKVCTPEQSYPVWKLLSLQNKTMLYWTRCNFCEKGRKLSKWMQAKLELFALGHKGLITYDGSDSCVACVCLWWPKLTSFLDLEFGNYPTIYSYHWLSRKTSFIF